MARRAIILDCDPGQDDAVNLLLAMSSPDDLDILGVTTVAGNVPLELTARNARLMCDIAGRRDVAVHAGCARPMMRRLVTAEFVHGQSGIDGVEIVEPATPLAAAHAVDFIVDTLCAAAPDSVTLVPTGPLTNVAMAIVKEPSILAAVREIVLMGGAMREGGNTTPSAEFNILVDPHAAHVVFDCGRPITAVGLDASHQVPAGGDRIRRIEGIGNRAAAATAGMLRYFSRHDSAKYGADGAPLHDPCTVAWLLEPSLFTAKPCNVAVETGSELTMGHTAVDFWGVTGRAPNANWIHAVDADGFYDLLTARLARY